MICVACSDQYCPERGTMAEGKSLLFLPIAGCPADAAGLLRLLSSRIDDAMLQEIAEADYSNDRDKHFAKLKLIRDKGIIPSPLQWHPQEVLELVRWSEPDNQDWKPGRIGVAGHLMRAFCCMALLCAVGNGESINGISDTLIQLIGSLEALGLAHEPCASALLIWFIPSLSLEVVGTSTLALACLALVALLLARRPTMQNETLGAAVNWFEAICIKDLELLGYHDGQHFEEMAAPDWRNTGIRDHQWMALAYRIDALPMVHLSMEVQARIRRMVAMIVMAA
jgi:hypothetical protein